jgi:eukaryotic-like serine/threonine-protein kinase
MPLTPGARLGPYEIVSPLGAGGMGEVYRARDTRLGRIVAIKIIRSDFAPDAEARRRFEREVRAISSLNHPHICTLHDVGREYDVDFLVMEHLEGETLARAIGRGPLPVDRVLRYAIQIAEALDAAHTHGVVHRDLKPHNIMLVSSGVKLLDFGLAGLLSKSAPSLTVASSNATQTLEAPLTIEGKIFGTIPYMAPEQLEGKALDARTDIFAFGAVLYEMATGRRAFEGETSALLAAAILRTEPPMVSDARPELPPALDHVIAHSLAKNPEERWQKARDVALELRWVQRTISAPVGASVRDLARARRRVRFGWIAAAVASLLALSLALVALFAPRAAPPDRTIRFTLHDPSAPPAEEPYWSHPAVSPDGGSVVYVGMAGGTRQLWIRSLDNLSSRALPGTEGASAPFWSTDGRYVAFFADGKLKKIEPVGGMPQIICSAAGPATCGSWSRDGTILFAVWEAPGEDGLYRVTGAGGEVARLTIREESGRECESPFFPHFLPDGRRFLFVSGGLDSGRVYLGSLDSPEAARPLAGVSLSRAEFVPPGYLISVRENTLLAQRFDEKQASVRGEPIAIAENVAPFGIDFSGSQNGVLVYRKADVAPWRLAWFDSTGRDLGSIGDAGDYHEPRISTDGQRFAVALNSASGRSTIWIYQVPQMTRTRLMPENEAYCFSPVWSPDGQEIVLSAASGAPPNLVRARLDGGDAEVVLPAKGHAQFVCDWSADGRTLLYAERDPKTGVDIWALPMTGTGVGDPVPILQTRFWEGPARFSPDSRWIAYVSDESGNDEVYVRPFPGPGQKLRVSDSGGHSPNWSGDGREILYVVGDSELVAVPIAGANELTIGTPRTLFRLSSRIKEFDVTKDGSRFLVIHRAENGGAPIHVVVNWAADIPR